jgi:hypothetical protein
MHVLVRRNLSTGRRVSERLRGTHGPTLHADTGEHSENRLVSCRDPGSDQGTSPSSSLIATSLVFAIVGSARTALGKLALHFSFDPAYGS